MGLLMRWRGLLIAIALLGVVAFSAVIVWVARDGQRGDTVSSPTASGSVAAVSPTSQAQEVALALDALVGDPASLAAEGVVDLVGDVRGMFPAGTVADPAAESWAPDGTGNGGTMTVVVTQPGEAPRSFLAVMVREHGTWKVLATLEEAEK